MTPAPEIKLRLLVHEDAVATAPSLDALRALVVERLGGVEPAVFVVERVVRRIERTRLPALREAPRLEDQVALYLASVGGEILDDARRARLVGKAAEVVGG